MLCPVLFDAVHI